MHIPLRCHYVNKIILLMNRIGEIKSNLMDKSLDRDVDLVIGSIAARNHRILFYDLKLCLDGPFLPQSNTMGHTS